MGHRGEREVERAKPEDGEDIRRVDQERVGGDREDRRNAIDREHHVDYLDHDQREEQWGREPAKLTRRRVWLAHPELLAVKLVGNRQMAADEDQRAARSDVIFMFGHDPHLDPGEDQERREHIQHPLELRDKAGAEADHDRAQHDHPEDAPEQHSMLVQARHREIGKDHRDDEHIVHRQALFDHKAGDELEAGGFTQIPPYPRTKAKAERDVARGQGQTFAHPDLALLAVQHAEIEREQGDDDGEEGEPHP